MGFTFFILFALIILGSYITLRRGLAPVRPTAAVSVTGSAISMALYLLTTRDTTAAYSIIFGMLSGSFFAGIALTLAWFFKSQDA